MTKHNTAPIMIDTDSPSDAGADAFVLKPGTPAWSRYWKAIRADFPIFQKNPLGSTKLSYLDSAASSQMPQSVIDSMVNYQSYTHSNVHRGIHTLSQRATDAFEDARKKVADFINAASADECVFVRGATEAINLVASSWGEQNLAAGDEVILTVMEHHSNIVPWQLLAEKRGFNIKAIPVSESGMLDMETFETLLSERTKLVGCIHVSNVLGTINPVKSIIEKAHNYGAKVLIDGCQAAPHLKVDVRDLDADFYVFSGHKMYGPTGIGVLYGKTEILADMPPYQGGGEMIDTVSFEGSTFKKPPARFEAGTPSIMPAIALGAAVDYIRKVGFDRMELREKELTRYALEKLGKVSGLRVIGEAENRVGAISFLIDSIHPHDIGSILDQCGVAVRVGQHCAEPLMRRYGVSGTVRASLGIYSSFKEIDALAEGLDTVLELFAC